LRRNPFIGIACGSKKKGSSERGNRCSIWVSKYQTTDTSLCRRDISRWVPGEAQGIQKHAKQFLKQAGAILL
jgi:hypothetical protein